MNSFMLYLKYISVSIRSQLQYKMSFVLFSFGHFFINGIEFLGLWALFSRFGNIKGWKLEEAALFYGLVNMIFAFSDALSRGFDILPQMIKSGEFDKILIRPRSTVIQIIGKELTLRRVGRFLVGLLVFIFAVNKLDLSIDIKNIVLFFLIFINGIFFFSSITIFQATASFWTVESLEIFNSLTYGGVYTAQYPLNIYKEYFQKFLLFIVPLGAVTYIPVCTMLGKEAFPWLTETAGFITPFAGLIFLMAAFSFWKLGIRHYTSVGN